VGGADEESGIPGFELLARLEQQAFAYAGDEVGAGCIARQRQLAKAMESNNPADIENWSEIRAAFAPRSSAGVDCVEGRR